MVESHRAERLVFALMQTGRRWLAAILLISAGVALAGCAGSGRVDLLSLDYTAIDPPAPQPAHLDIDRCYWWTDEQGQVCVALERDAPSLIGPAGRFVFQLVLTLERPPAGKARNYLLSKEQLRARVRVGPTESRYAAVNGIAALYRQPDERLRGSFRLQVTRQAGRLLGGWGRASRALLTGSFEALHDEERGRVIAAQVEATAERAGESEEPAPPAGEVRIDPIPPGQR